MAARLFRPGGKFQFNWEPESHKVYYGKAVDGDEVVIDEVRTSTDLNEWRLVGTYPCILHACVMKVHQDGMQQIQKHKQARPTHAGFSWCCMCAWPGTRLGTTRSLAASKAHADDAIAVLMVQVPAAGAADGHACSTLLHFRGCH